MAELKGQQVQFVGSKSYADAIKEVNGNIHFTTDANGSIVVNGKVYGTVNSNLMSTPTSGSLKQYIDDKVTNGIGTLDVTDTAVSGKYVSAVSESNGKITVTRADLPVLSGGATGTDVKPIKSVTVDGHKITVTTVDANLATEANLTNHINDKVKHITAEERALWNDAATYISAFLEDSAAGEAAIDTLKEIQKFLEDDTTGTSELTSKVNKSVKDVVNSFGVWTNSEANQDIRSTFSLNLTLNDGTSTTYESTLNVPYAASNKYGVVKIGTGLSVSSGVVSLDTNTKMANATEADYAYTAGAADTAKTATNIAGGATGTIFYNTAANTTEALAIGTAGQVLKVVNGVPSWETDLNNKVKVTRSEDATYLIGISSEGNGGDYDALNNSYVYTKSGKLYAKGLSVSDVTITMNGKPVASQEYVDGKIDVVNASIDDVNASTYVISSYIEALSNEVDVLSYKIDDANNATGSVSSYVEALSSEVATLSYDVEIIKSYLLWQ